MTGSTKERPITVQNTRPAVVIDDQRHAKKVAARKAIVAVASKLTTRIYPVLKERRRFVLREVSATPSTAEETAGTRERLDGQQNEQHQLEDSFLRQRTRAFGIAPREGRIPQSVPTSVSGHV